MNKSILTITLADGVIMLEPVPEEIRKLLTYWHKSLAFNPEKRKRVVSGEYRKLYTESPRPNTKGELTLTLTAPIGLASRIIYLAKQLEYEIAYIDSRTPPPTIDQEKGLSILREYQKEGVQIALNSQGGIIECPTGWGKSYLQAAIIKAFDPEDLKMRNTPLIVLTAPEKDLLDQLYAGLVELFPDRDVGCLHSGKTKMSEDILVVSIDSLHRIDSKEVGILLIDEVHEAATASRVPKILAMDKALKWGFSATPYGRFDNADMVTEALVGPTVYKKTYKDGVDVGALVPITVCWLTAPEPTMGVDNIHSYHRRDAQLRHGIIKNTNLNNLIIEILDRCKDKQIMCIMEQLEHMNELVTINPALQYVHGATTQKSLKPSRHYNLKTISTKERKDIYAKVKSGEISTILSTSIYRQGVDFPNLEIIINLGIVSSSIVTRQIPGRASRNTKSKESSYIVDFWNSWDKDTAAFTKTAKPGLVHKIDLTRQKEYAKLGFNQIWVENIDDLPFLIEQ